jgi:hypothetical protein
MGAINLGFKNHRRNPIHAFTASFVGMMRCYICINDNRCLTQRLAGHNATIKPENV